MQPEYKIAPSHQAGTAPDTDGTSLPGSARADIRSTLIHAGRIGAVSLPVERSPSQIPLEPLYRPSIPLNQLIIAILQQTQPNILPSLVPGGAGQGTGTDPLLDALQRLVGHGILPTRDGLVVPPRDPPSPRSHPASRHHTRPETTPSNRTTEISPPNTNRSETPRAERSPEGGGARHAHGQPTQEPLSEEKIRQILEKALAAFHERRGDGSPTLERNPGASPSPERTAGERALDRGGEPRLKEPAIETTLSPSVRDALNDPRNETARLIQQLLTGDLQQGRQSPAPIAGVSNTDRSASHQLEPTLISVRAGINEGLSQIRDALQTTIERSSPRPPSSSNEAYASSAQATKPGDFTRVDPVRRHQAPTVTIQGEERTTPRPPHEPANPLFRAVGGEKLGLSLSSPGALRPAGHPSAERATTPLDNGTSLLDAIARAAQKALSLQTLRRIDQAVETAVISAAAAVALGVIGGDIVLKEIIALGKDLLNRLRSRTDKSENHEEEIKEIRDLVQELEELYGDRDVETIDQPAGFVADITGTIRHHDTDHPLEGIEVDGGTLGVTLTNSRGEFIFKNVPLDTGYVVYARSAEFSFFPHPAQGTVSAITNLSIFGRRV